MNNSIKKLGIILLVMMLSVIPITSFGATYTQADSPNYVKTADGTLELLYNGTLTEGGKTYVSFIIAKDYGGTQGKAGIKVLRAIEGNNTQAKYGIIGRWDTNTVVSDFETEVIADLPQGIASNLYQYNYYMGTWGYLNPTYGGLETYNNAKITVASSTDIDNHIDYLEVFTEDNTFRFAGGDSSEDDKIASRTPAQNVSETGGNQLKMAYYDISDNAWQCNSGNANYTFGSVFATFYMNIDAFKSVKMDVSTMSQNVKTLLLSNIARKDLKLVGYSDAELRLIGYPDDYTFSVTNTPDLTLSEISIDYKFENNTNDAISTPVFLAAAYNGGGKIVGAICVNPQLNSVVSGRGNVIANLKINVTEAPQYVILYNFQSLSNPLSYTEKVIVGAYTPVAVTASTENAELSFDVDETTTPKKVKASVSGTLTAAAGGTVLTVVTKPGKTLADLATDSALNVLLYINSVDCNSEGKYGTEFNLVNTDMSYKKYSLSVYYGLTTSLTVSSDELYTDSGIDTAVATDIKSMTISAFGSKYSEIFTLDTTLSALLTDPQNEQKARAAVVTTNKTAIEIIDNLHKEMAVQALYNTQTSLEAQQIVADWNKYMNLDLTNYIDKLLPEQQTEVYGFLASSEYSNFDELENIYFGGYFVSQINDVTYYKNIKSILEQNPTKSKELGVDVTLSDFDGIASYLVSGPYTDWSAFSNAFAAAKSDYDKANAPVIVPSAPPSGGVVSSGKDTIVVNDSNESGVPGSRPEDPEPTPEIIRVIDFEDVSEDMWAKEYIDKLVNLGILSGRSEKLFYPDDFIKREEVAKIISFTMSFDASYKNSIFEDVDSNSWYAGYVVAAYKNNVVKGTAETIFGVGKNITREDLAVMIFRTLDLKSDVEDTELFEDNAEISEYARDAVYTLSKMGVLSGKGENKFDPKGFATRAEVAKIVCIAFDK